MPFRQGDSPAVKRLAQAIIASDGKGSRRNGNLPAHPDGPHLPRPHSVSNTLSHDARPASGDSAPRHTGQHSPSGIDIDYLTTRPPKHRATLTRTTSRDHMQRIATAVGEHDAQRARELLASLPSQSPCITIGGPDTEEALITTLEHVVARSGQVRHE